MTGISDLDDLSFDHRQIQAGRHAIIEQAKIAQVALAVVDVFLVERPSEPLCASALHLTFDVARMNCPAGVLGDGAAQNLTLAGIRIHFDIDQGYGKGRAHAARIDRGTADDRTTSASQSGGELLHRDWRDPHVLIEGVPGTGKTMLVKTLGHALNLSFSRIQFTVDLMPADITGTR